MVEMRWAMHDFNDGPPPSGSICIGDRLYQKLQYRTQKKFTDYIYWGEWKDVKFTSGDSNNDKR